MKNIMKALFIFLGLIAINIVTGCATKGGQLPDVRGIQPPSAEFVKLKATYSFCWVVLRSECYKPSEDQKSEFVSVLNKSGYFAHLTEGDGGDIRIGILLKTRSKSDEKYGPPAAAGSWNGDPWLAINLATLSIIPYCDPMTFDVTAQVVTKDKKEKTYSLTDSVTYCFWAPLIVTAPFLLNVDRDVRENIWRNLLLKMQEDGFLPKPVPDQITNHGK